MMTATDIVEVVLTASSLLLALVVAGLDFIASGSDSRQRTCRILACSMVLGFAAGACAGGALIVDIPAEPMAWLVPVFFGTILSLVHAVIAARMLEASETRRKHNLNQRSDPTKRGR